ncbi:MULTISPECIES: hypothetical protein [Enterococcus]|uniref:Uncharacterized protein n=1 Tax=Enterococcus lactis TaxID=357441 RepID=A0AAJ1WCM5_9ENTE|nr:MULTISPECIES: hypothetical protein [Enterococcus]MBX9062361.1 hypothetical protein [Enterococcus faecium]MDP8590529.1 hypothetical protein [Enterococcus lactis]MDP8597606.1 hypothetical protein [Enterococcus lactis]MDT2804856.1 hypothetical protein [Enterococcus lactis]MUP36075.1 hypothetical protein [Enterococcus lactis]
MEEREEIIVRPESALSKNGQFDLRRRPLQRYKERKRNKLVSDLAVQLANVPQFIEAVGRSREKVLDISKEVAEKIANGELVFSRKGATGEAVGILRDAKTGKLFTQLPIKEMPLELGSTIASAGLSLKMQEISNKLEILDGKINRVNRNFDLNRYAEVQSAGDKFKVALLTKDTNMKKALLLEAYSQATNAKNLLLNQLYETKEQLRISRDDGNLIQTVFGGKKADAEASLAQAALDNIDYMKDAFSFQIASLAELGEYDALNYEVSDFQDLISKDFSGDDALYLDGHLPPTSTNPFKYLSESVLESSTEIIDFLDHNEDLLEVHFLPEMLNFDKEEDGDGAERL